METKSHRDKPDQLYFSNKLSHKLNVVKNNVGAFESIILKSMIGIYWYSLKGDLGIPCFGQFSMASTARAGELD